ncbi:hypothetical protein [Virgibacillus necropolis]|uniref:Uncharacterized protein n=1 Tax=Virgibacillus necropolis TaxID=163877 RepID=A0A221MCT4_9BACI|nr:hypothetical protein [Virgibacillus necropolis]ASN05441.1 hypothetical protein CFK40_10685 [Virgibacillus necropolis]
MMFFKSMTEKESANWKKGAILGFYTYMLLLAINQIYYLVFASNPFSSALIFWSGLIAAFGCEIIFNLKDKRKLRRNKV